uniref:FBD domain-containing protein n=1 Tax=Brassica oleracea TaxID=3712 RepID=A0A3P6FXY5_BRAOL|nr:unnamed protein product [Brassica oleracea]
MVMSSTLRTFYPNYLFYMLYMIIGLCCSELLIDRISLVNDCANVGEIRNMISRSVCIHVSCGWRVVAIPRRNSSTEPKTLYFLLQKKSITVKQKGVIILFDLLHMYLYFMVLLSPISISQDKRMKEDLPKGPSESTILSVASSAIANLAMNEKSRDLIMNKGGAQLLARNVSWCTCQFMRKSICKSQYGNIFEEALCWDNSCPILEDLVVDLDEEDTIQKLTVAVPSLQNLSFYIPWSNDISGFVIDTPALKYFKLRDHNYQSHDGLIENMPYLIEAYVDCCRPDINSLIGSITSVRRLAICLETMLDEGFVFNQLEHLEVCLCKEHFSNQLFRLLKASSKLKRLHLFFMNSDLYVQADMDDWNEPSTAPECILSSLQSLSWLKYTGEPQEREVVVYILKHALHLKTATIKSFESEVPKFDMLKELSLSSRASATCQLMFD